MPPSKALRIKTNEAHLVLEMLKLPSLHQIATFDQLGRASQLRNHTSKKYRGLLNKELHKNDSKNNSKNNFDNAFEKLLEEAENVPTTS